jgi:S1-C subfamily serine protease
MDPEAIRRVTEGWGGRVFLVVADAGPCRRDVDEVLRDPRALFRKRRVGCAVYVGGGRRLLTTASVVGRGQEVEIFRDDGRHMLARVIGTDPYLDVALLEAMDDLSDAAGFSLRDDGDEPRAGMPCLVLGRAYGRTLSATLGRMGGTIEIEPGGLPVRAHRVLAPIYPGDAGGAVLDGDGNFVGLVTGVSTPCRPPVRDEFGEIDLSRSDLESAGTVGFAVPARECQRAWEDLAKDGRMHRGFLGIRIAAQGDEQGGVRVLDVAPGGPAERAGILPGDLITTYGRHFLATGRELCALVAYERPSRAVEIRLMRSGHEIVMDVTLDEAEALPGLRRIPFAPPPPDRRRAREVRPVSEEQRAARR